MSFLNRLVDEHLQGLSGAEFKVAAYLYRKLERRQEVEMTIAKLGSAARGERQTNLYGVVEIAEEWTDPGD